MSMMCHITAGYSKEPLIKLLYDKFNVRKLRTLKPKTIESNDKDFVNGHWIGSVDDPVIFTETFKNHRRISLIPVQTSISHGIFKNQLFLLILMVVVYVDQFSILIVIENLVMKIIVIN